MVLSDVSAELIRRQLPGGGWSALAASVQAALEPTCYSVLALGSQATDVRDCGYSFLLHAQNPNGSWPVFAGDDHDGSWVTSLVTIVLRDLVSAIPARLKGVHWLLSSAGKEGNWLWKWKFRTTDRHVRFDPDKFGWPWFPDTVSWVAPTAFPILALKQLSCSCGGFELASRGWIVQSRCFWIVPAPVADGMRETVLSTEPPLHPTPMTRRSHSWHSAIDHRSQLYKLRSPTLNAPLPP